MSSGRVDKIAKVVKKNWDELGIAAALGHFAASGDLSIPDNHFVLEALRRSKTELHDADPETLREYLQSLDDDQLPGLINNIKGIAHEIYYIEAENSDGDPVRAYLFEDTNHKDYDVVLVDTETNQTSQIQLKATNSQDYVKDTVTELGEDQVVVTQEMADKLGLESSGISNQELTANVEEVVDQLIEDQSLWDYVPGLTLWSIALIVASLARRYSRGEISLNQFTTMVAAFAGAKAVKVALIIAALSVPGFNIVVAAGLFVKMAWSLREVYGKD